MMNKSGLWRWFAGAAIVLLVGIGLYLQALKPSIVVLQLTYSHAAFDAVIAQWTQLLGPDAIAVFRRHFVADYLLIACFGLAGWLYGREQWQLTGHKRWLWLQWVLPVAALCDVAEDTLHLWFTSGAQGIGDGWYAFCGACSTVKWCGLLLFIAMALKSRRYLKNRHNRQTRPASAISPNPKD